MVIGISIFSKFMMNSHRSVMPYIEKFWWHVACSGMVAKAFTLKTGTFYQENEFIGALLHDIGKLAMLQYDNEKYLKVIELIENQGISDLEAENQVYKCDHTQVGYAIAASWNLPMAIQDIVRYHHRPAEATNNKALVATVRCIDLLCEMWQSGFYENIPHLDLAETDAWKTLIEEVPDLADTDIAQFTFELEAEFRRSEEFLHLISDET
jgi:putative nucleotidyltransferase with HDIG domain